jgi:hypothetical protein
MAHQYIQPTANPTPRLTNRRGNSMTGALTGIRAVISPRQLMTEEITRWLVPIYQYTSFRMPVRFNTLWVAHRCP